LTLLCPILTLIASVIGILEAVKFHDRKRLKINNLYRKHSRSEGYSEPGIEISGEEAGMSNEIDLDDAGDGPKYKRIYQKLREMLSTGTYAEGHKLPSEGMLVEKFGASRPTIRRALAQLESDGFVEKKMGSGTVVSQRTNRKSLVFGLLIPELGMTEIFEPICHGISQARIGTHHELLWGPNFVPGGSKEDQAESLCRYYIDREVSGVFFAPMELFEGRDEVNLQIVRAFDEAQIPVVLLDRDIMVFPHRSKYDVIGIDNRRAGYVLTEHLLLTGSKRIAFLARPFSAHTGDISLVGYREALVAHQGDDAQSLIKWADPTDLVAMRDFLVRANPDAIVCANDYTAAQLMITLNEFGIQVPGQIRVAGMDDVKYAELLQTPLTTIHQPCQEIGSAALLAMLDRIARPTAPSRDVRVDFQLMIRKSTEPDRQNRQEARQTPVAERVDLYTSQATGEDVPSLPAFSSVRTDAL
jgi:GntR family transcriptional regulator of arabinose operon